jgi:ribosomal protein S18 acetylase RimI-like enzyme
MYVAPEARGQGLAKRLLHMAREHAQQLGLRQLLLGCNADNGQALRLYEQAGFRRYGLAPEAIGLDGRFFDEVLMVLPLTAGPR